METAVWQALGRVQDPLLGQGLVDLGLVGGVRVAAGGRVQVQLLLPSPHWPEAEALASAAQAAVAALPGVAAADVQVVAAPPWTPYRLAPSLKSPLGLPADEPPPPAAPPPGRVQRLLSRMPGRKNQANDPNALAGLLTEPARVD